MVKPICGHEAPPARLRDCPTCFAKAAGLWYQVESDYWEESWRRDGFHGLHLSADQKRDEWTNDVARISPGFIDASSMGGFATKREAQLEAENSALVSEIERLGRLQNRKATG